MSRFRTHRLGEMGWTEAKDAVTHDPVVLLPVGTVEQHGPHLPLAEDAITAEWVADQVAERTDALVAPLMPYGYSPIFRGYSGTISLQFDTVRAVLTDVLKELARHGFRRLVVVNNHGGNSEAVAQAAWSLRDDYGLLVGTVYPWSLGYGLMRDQYENADQVYGHGAEPELSAMLAMFPEMVQTGLAETSELESADGWTPASASAVVVPGQEARGAIFRDFSEISRTGVTGSVDVASPERGKIWVDRILDFCTEFVREYERNTASR